MRGRARTSLVVNWVVSYWKEGLERAELVSVVEEAIVNGVAGVRGRDGQDGLAGHCCLLLLLLLLMLLKMESDEEAVKADEADVAETSLKAGEMAPWRRLSTPTWTILSRIGASGVLFDRISWRRLVIVDAAKAGRGVATAGEMAAGGAEADGYDVDTGS